MWVRPSVLAKLAVVVGYVLVVALGVAGAVSARSEMEWWLVLLGIPAAVVAVQGLGSGVRIDDGEWLLRGVFKERTLPADAVRGISFEGGLEVVVMGGATFQTTLVQGPKRPHRSRRVRTAAVLARASGIDVPVITQAELTASRRQLSEDEREVLRACIRSRFYRPTWWQWVLYAAWLAVVLGTLVS